MTLWQTFKSLAFLRVCLALGKNLNLLWQFLLYNWANFYRSKRPNIEQIIYPSGHTVVNPKPSAPRHNIANGVRLKFVKRRRTILSVSIENNSAFKGGSSGLVVRYRRRLMFKRT